MPAPVRIELTDAARAELVTRFNVTRDADARLRYQMVLLAAAGRTATALRCTGRTTSASAPGGRSSARPRSSRGGRETAEGGGPCLLYTSDAADEL